MADYKLKQARPSKAARRPPKRDRGEQVRAHEPARRRASDNAGRFEGGAYPETRLQNPDGQFRLPCAGCVLLLPMRYAASSPPAIVCEPLLPAPYSSCAPRTSACSTERNLFFLFFPPLPVVCALPNPR